MSRRGLLVVFEGAEGVGKSTQVERLAAWLAAAGVPHHRFREPGGTPLGEAVRALLLDPANEIEPGAEALLFMAARAQLLAEARTLLAQGHVVVLDRFFLSTYAYQVAGRGLPEGEIRAANALATAGLVPDVTLLLALPDDEAGRRVDARGGRDRIERAGSAFHARVAAAFLAFADPAWGAAHPEAGPIVRIDATGAPETVGARLLGALAERWPETFPGVGESQ